MLVTLNKANKLLSKLNSYLNKNFTKSGDSVNINTKFNILYTGTITDTDKFMKETTKCKTEKKETLDQYFSLLEDYHKLKEQLFKENITSGLSEALYKITVHTTKVNVLSGIFKNIDSDYSSLLLNDDLVDKINNRKYDNYSNSVSIAVFDKEDISNRLAIAKAELNLLEDQKEHFNSHKKINIELDDHTKSVLGL